jgi:hypothetical protein
MAALLSPTKLQTIAPPLNWITARLSAMLPSSAAEAYSSGGGRLV